MLCQSTCLLGSTQAPSQGPPKRLIPFLNLDIQIVHLVTMDPNSEHWKPATKNCDIKTVSKLLKMQECDSSKRSLASHQEGILQRTQPGVCNSIPLTRQPAKTRPWPSPYRVTWPTLALNPLLTYSHYFLRYKVSFVFYSLNITRQRFLT